MSPVAVAMTTTLHVAVAAALYLDLAAALHRHHAGRPSRSPWSGKLPPPAGPRRRHRAPTPSRRPRRQPPPPAAPAAARAPAPAPPMRAGSSRRSLPNPDPKAATRASSSRRRPSPRRRPPKRPNPTRPRSSSNRRSPRRLPHRHRRRRLARSRANCHRSTCRRRRLLPRKIPRPPAPPPPAPKAPPPTQQRVQPAPPPQRPSQQQPALQSSPLGQRATDAHTRRAAGLAPGADPRQPGRHAHGHEAGGRRSTSGTSRRSFRSISSSCATSTAEAGNLVLSITIARDGRLVDVGLSRSSGVPALDNFALNMVRQARSLSRRCPTTFRGRSTPSSCRSTSSETDWAAPTCAVGRGRGTGPP